MIRIICAKCKNAYLKKDEGNLTCPSCEAVFSESQENLLAGIQYYNEGDFTQANDYLMKHIVKNGADPEAIFYKALCDSQSFDEDTLSLNDLYAKLIEVVSEISDDLFPVYLALANDECEKLEKLIAENHIKQFETADAEKIKKEVSIIINLQNEAKDFRKKLTEIVADYNERAMNKISVKLSSCCLVEPQIASEVGSLKFGRVKESIEAHTVFTGILSTDIKNLEIYYRCIVMFFEKNRQKYDFLMESSEKFTELSNLLEEGRYSSIKGVSSIATKLKSAAYDFFQESLKDHDDEFEQQTETVVIIAPETVEILVEETEEEAQSENIPDSTDEEAPIEYEDVYSSSDEENTVNPEEETTSTEEVETYDNAENSVESEDTVIEIATADETVTEEVQEDDVFELPAEESEDDTLVSVEEPEAEEIVTENTEADMEELPQENSSEETVAEIPEETDIPETSPVETVEETTDNGATEETNDDANYEKVEATKESTLVVKRKKSYGPFIAIFLVIFAIVGLIALKVVPEKLNQANYEKATQLLNEKNYAEAAVVFAELGDYSDSEEKTLESLYQSACSLESQKKYVEAKAIFADLDNYKDSAAKKDSCAYNAALSKLDDGKFDEAAEIFKTLDNYADSKKMIKECSYKKAVSLINNKDFESAIEILIGLGNYSDSETKILEAKYGYVSSNLDANNKTTTTYLKDLVKAKYKDSADLRNKLLGTTEEADGGVTSCINYSATNTQNNLKEADRSKVIYFHVVVNQPDLYNKTLTVDYVTSMGYHETKDVVLTETDNTYAFAYPSTPSADYTVTFKLISPDGKILTQQEVLIK